MQLHAPTKVQGWLKILQGLGDETPPPSWMNAHTTPRSFVSVFKYIPYTMLIESTEICKIYLEAVCVTDLSAVQEKQTTKQ